MDKHMAIFGGSALYVYYLSLSFRLHALHMLCSPIISPCKKTPSLCLSQNAGNYNL